MLEIKDVGFGYSKSLEFCFSYNFDLQTPVVIHGVSGSGKSTLLHIICGLISPFSGSIKYNNEDLFKLSPSDRPLSILFQRGNLFDHISCLRNVEIGLNCKGGLGEFTTVIEETFHKLGISNLRNKLPSEISGGQRKRVALARVIVRARCLNKKLVLLDEPFNGLDAAAKMKCIKTLLEMKLKEKCKIIIVSHDINDPVSIGANTVNLEEIQTR